MFKLQNYAIPRNKLREHLKQVGTKINPTLLPIPELSGGVEIRVSAIFVSGSMIGAIGYQECDCNKCCGGQSFQ